MISISFRTHTRKELEMLNLLLCLINYLGMYDLTDVKRLQQFYIITTGDKKEVGISIEFGD